MDATDKEIDRLVYELYGLSDEEIPHRRGGNEPPVSWGRKGPSPRAPGNTQGGVGPPHRGPLSMAQGNHPGRGGPPKPRSSEGAA